MAKQILIADAHGETQIVTAKAFELIYQPKGYSFVSDAPEADQLTDEISSQAQQSALEDTGKASDSGQSRPAVGRGTRKSNKAKNS